MNSLHTKILSYISAIVFTMVLAGTGVMFFMVPKEGISLIEKRKLAVMPQFTQDALYDSLYTDSMNVYLADNFPYRDFFVGTSFWLKECKGLLSEEVGLFYVKKKGYGKWKHAKLKTKKAVVDSTNDSAEGDLMSDWIFFSEGRAMQLFGGTDGMAAYYASTINKYQEALKGRVNIYNIVIPTPAEFYFPPEYKKLTRPEKPNIDIINANLSPGIKAVDAYSELLAHKNEYLYFRTDHHWTALGAYYAYTAFCRSAGLYPLPLKSLVKKTKYNFIGSLYGITQDSRLLEKPDTVEYFLIPGNYKTYVYDRGTQKVCTPGRLLCEEAAGGYSYGVFLGADFPLMRIDNDIKNGRRAILVKNSYGNPFAPFLVPHFEQVFIVDYRYFNRGLIQMIIDNKITDLIFINSVALANGTWHVQCINRIMYYFNQPVKMPADSLMQKSAADSASKKI